MSGLIAPPARRWAVSFADLALLIACVLLLGWRPEPTGADAARASAASQVLELPTARLFVSDEAILAPTAAVQLDPARRALADGAAVGIAVGIGSGGSQRLDAWELAAARTAALARALGGGNRVHLAAPGPGDQVVIDTRR